MNPPADVRREGPKDSCDGLYYANLTEPQIAHALNIAPGTVKSRLSRAVAQLATNSHLIEGNQS